MAASLGAGLPIDEPAGFMVVDIGGGTTDIAVLSSGDVVQARSLRVRRQRHGRGDHPLRAPQASVCVIGEGNAERIKIEAGTALAQPNGRAGRDPHQGPRLAPGPAEERRAGAAGHGRGAEPSRSRRWPSSSSARWRTCRPRSPTDMSRPRHRPDRRRRAARQARRRARPARRRQVPGAGDPMHCVIKGSAEVLQTLGTREHLLIKP